MYIKRIFAIILFLSVLLILPLHNAFTEEITIYGFDAVIESGDEVEGGFDNASGYLILKGWGDYEVQMIFSGISLRLVDEEKREYEWIGRVENKIIKIGEEGRFTIKIVSATMSQESIKISSGILQVASSSLFGGLTVEINDVEISPEGITVESIEIGDLEISIGGFLIDIHNTKYNTENPIITVESAKLKGVLAEASIGNFSITPEFPYINIEALEITVGEISQGFPLKEINISFQVGEEVTVSGNAEVDVPGIGGIFVALAIIQEDGTAILSSAEIQVDLANGIPVGSTGLFLTNFGGGFEIAKDGQTITMLSLNGTISHPSGLNADVAVVVKPGDETATFIGGLSVYEYQFANAQLTVNVKESCLDGSATLGLPSLEHPDVEAECSFKIKVNNNNELVFEFDSHIDISALGYALANADLEFRSSILHGEATLNIESLGNPWVVFDIYSDGKVSFEANLNLSAYGYTLGNASLGFENGVLHGEATLSIADVCNSYVEFSIDTGGNITFLTEVNMMVWGEEIASVSIEFKDKLLYCAGELLDNTIAFIVLPDGTIILLGKQDVVAVVEPRQAELRKYSEIEVSLTNCGHDELREVWVLLQICDGQGNIVETTKMLEKSGGIDFGESQGKNLGPGESRALTANYAFGVSSLGHTYTVGMYYYSCFVYHYPFEPLRQPELVNDPQRLDLQLIEPSISEHLDAVIIIDRSGSMTYPMSNLDPTQRIVKALQAAVVFAEFIETGDYASVIDFAGDVHVTRSLSHIDNKEALKVDIRSVRVGEWNGTNIGDSLLEAYKQLMYSPSGNLEKCVILLTDGAHNTGTHPLNAISQCENFISHTWPVHTIGFGSGDEFDEPLLKEIANRTGGQYERAGGKVDELGAFYAKIATEMHGGTTVFRNRDFANQGQTIIEGVEIDPLTQGAHFTLNWGGSRMNLLLKSPSGRVITPAEAQTSPDMEYFEGKIYAIYKMALPEPGRWEIEIQGVEIPAGGEEFVFSAAVNSFISSNLLPFKPSYSVSEPVPIGIILKSKSISGAYVPITNAQVRALVERPDGTSINLTLYDSGQHGDQKAQDGVFANLYTHTEVQGAHLITVSITGRTSSEIPFSREVKETVIVGAKNSIFINRTSLRPKPGTTIAERTPTISARISGPSRNIDISSIVLSVDGQTVKHAYDSVNQIVSYQPPTPLESRKHTITLQVSDTKGNSLPKSSWEFTVDAIAIIESVSLSGSPAKLGGEISVVLRAEQGGEATFSIQNVVLHIPLIETVPGTYTGTYKVKPGIDVKDATLSVFFTDTLGNETENRSQKVTIDTIPPTINMQIPKEGTLYRYGDTINFKLITEPGSTVTIDISEIAANLGIISMKENSTVPGEFYGTAIISKDNTAQPGEKTIKIKDKDAIGNVAEAIMKLFLGKPVPQENALLQNYPNPFNAETWIPYQLSKGAEVTVEIYDVSGRLIRRLYAGIKEPGFYKDRDTALRWEGRNLNGEVVSSGVYFYHIKAGSFTATRKMVIVR